ncbi:MAG: RNA recognition motif domain-containing protein [Spirochaetota bacterium]
MSNRIYVGNVNFRTTEEGLQSLFSNYGEVVSVRMITDRDTGRYRGFSFVEMASEEQANAAVEALNGTELDDRPLKVNIAHERERQPRNDRY